MLKEDQISYKQCIETSQIECHKNGPLRMSWHKRKLGIDSELIIIDKSLNQIFHKIKTQLLRIIIK